jgi:MSHA biogenesis protein MshP
MTLMTRPGPFIRHHPCQRRRSRGLGMIAALVVLVLLASLAAAIVRLGWTQQTTIAQDIDSARASQSAQAGIQWGLFQALPNGGSWNACATPTQTLDLRSQTGYMVTVTCAYTDYNEGERVEGASRLVRLFTIEATACSTTSACPDAARVASPNYVERRMRVQANNCQKADGSWESCL